VDSAEVIAASEGARSSLAESEAACLRFTRDFTLHSHTMGEERIDQLRMFGLSDGAILDLAYVAGVINGMIRLVASLVPLEETAPA